MNQPTVLIIGAGPTGLMAACQLALHGIDFLIVEKNQVPSKLSKALGIQARTLEIFEQMGMIDKVLANGIPGKGMTLFTRGEPRFSVPIEKMGEGLSPYPYIFMLAQNLTEDYLREFLKSKGKKVEWDTEVLEIRQTEELAEADIRFAGGKSKTLPFNWIIGADGAHSIVRHHMPVKFEGEKYPNRFWLADAKAEGIVRPEFINVMLARIGFAIFFPMKGESRYRVIGVLPEDWEDDRKLEIDELSQILEKKYKLNVRISDSHWTATYNLHHRKTDQFRHKRFFLGGDAAHIHSPVGGQGMNTGLQDMYNLCWKIALVEKGIAKCSLLDTYHTERHPFAEQLLKTTDRIFVLAITKNPIIKFFQLYLMPLVVRPFVRLKFIQTLLFKTISQTGIRYRKSPLSVQTSTNQKIKAGDRFPYFLMNSGDSVFQYFQNTAFNLLIPQDHFKSHQPGFENLQKQFPGLLQIHQIPEDENTFFMETSISQKDFILVRPDMYIACLGRNVKALETYFEKIFS